MTRIGLWVEPRPMTCSTPNLPTFRQYLEIPSVTGTLRTPLTIATSLLATLMLIHSAQAVVNSTTTTNTSAPADDPGWSNVGIINRATGIYLGNRWMLTAAHVGVGDVTFDDGRTFSPDTLTRFDLTNPAGEGLTPLADLVMFQLTEDPGLPPLHISQTPPPIGGQVTVIGNGRDWDGSLRYWKVQRGTNWTWTEVSQPADYAGYVTVPGGDLRWATNLIENDTLHKANNDADHRSTVRSIDSSNDALDREVVVLLTEFDGPNKYANSAVKGPDGKTETEFESHAVVNDSGGAMFYKHNGLWELAGMTVAVDGFRDQDPPPSFGAIFGNLTFYADLSYYADQLTSRFVLGDFDGDLLLTAADIDALTLAVRSEEPSLSFDLDGDGKVNQADRTYWVNELRRTYFGDANLDGQFSSTDLIVVFRAGEYEDDVPLNSTWAEGDFNGDLEFTSSDMIVGMLTGAYEAGPRPTTGSVSTMIPEPSSLSLAVIGLLAWTFVRHRSRRVKNG